MKNPGSKILSVIPATPGWRTVWADANDLLTGSYFEKPIGAWALVAYENEETGEYGDYPFTILLPFDLSGFHYDVGSPLCMNSPSNWIATVGPGEVVSYDMIEECKKYNLARA